MFLQYRWNTRAAQSVVRAKDWRALWEKRREFPSLEVEDWRITQVVYQARVPYQDRYQRVRHDLTKPAEFLLRRAEESETDTGAALVRQILSYNQLDCPFRKSEEAAALFQESTEDPFGRHPGSDGGGCMDVVFKDGRSARYIFGRAIHLPEPSFGLMPPIELTARVSPADFERNVMRTRQMPAVPAHWMQPQTVAVPWWSIGAAAAAAAAAAAFM